MENNSKYGKNGCCSKNRGIHVWIPCVLNRHIEKFCHRRVHLLVLGELFFSNPCTKKNQAELSCAWLRNCLLNLETCQALLACCCWNQPCKVALPFFLWQLFTKTKSSHHFYMAVEHEKLQNVASSKFQYKLAWLATSNRRRNMSKLWCGWWACTLYES